MKWTLYLSELQKTIDNEFIHRVAKVVLAEQEYLAFICEHERNYRDKVKISQQLKITPFRANQLIEGYRRKMMCDDTRKLFAFYEQSFFIPDSFVDLEINRHDDLLLEGFKIILKRLSIFFDGLPHNTIQADLIFLLNKDDVILFYKVTKDKHFIDRKNNIKPCHNMSELQTRFYISVENLKMIKPLVSYWGGDLNTGYRLIDGFS